MSSENLDNNNLIDNNNSSPFYLDTDINENELDISFYNFYNNRLFDETSSITSNTRSSQDSRNSQNSQNLRKTSFLWNYISYETSTHPGIPVCMKCNFAFSPKSGNSSMERHLLSKHQIKIPKVNKQQTVLNFQCTDPWPSKKKSERDQVVVIWIISDQQSFRVVENEKFIKMMNTFDPRYKVLNRHQVKEIVMQEFDKRRSNIGYDLRKIPGKVAFTTDMWTSTLNGKSFLGLTIHYIDQDWNFQRFLLDIIPFQIRHTGVNIANTIINILNEFNLTNITLSLTTDNESAMVVCGKKLAEEFEQALNSFSFKHYRCSAHILNLAVQHGMEIIDEEILNIRKLMTKIKKSVLLCDDLRELCNIEKLQYLRPEIDVKTRWNSTFYMLQKLQRMETALKMLAIKHENIRNLMPNAITWKKIKVNIY
jgi:hypothetical protein